jgi:hypothetical protein
LSRDFGALRVDCVSRPSHQDFPRFLHYYSDFQADCVSRGLPDDFGQWVAIERIADHHFASNALTQAMLAVIAGMARVPLRTRSAVPRLLALFAAAASLTLASALVWLEPFAAFAARALASHRCCLLKRGKSVA